MKKEKVMFGRSVWPAKRFKFNQYVDEKKIKLNLLIVFLGSADLQHSSCEGNNVKFFILYNTCSFIV